MILDAKRGDVGNTAGSVTPSRRSSDYGATTRSPSNPYLGTDALEPFLRHADRGVIVLCRTSNAGGRDLQELQVGERPLYQVVAELAATRWNSRGNCLLVVGATYPQELAQVRALVGDGRRCWCRGRRPGGDVAQAVRAGQTAAGTGLLVSSSRAILYGACAPGPDFAHAARRAALALREQINASRLRRPMRLGAGARPGAPRAARRAQWLRPRPRAGPSWCAAVARIRTPSTRRRRAALRPRVCCATCARA